MKSEERIVKSEERIVNSEELIVKSDRGNGEKMENRYRIIVCDLEKKEVKIDQEIFCFLGSYVTALEKKSVSDIYALCCGDVTIERTEGMLKATKDAARKIKRQIIKEEIKKMFGVRE